MTTGIQHADPDTWCQCGYRRAAHRDGRKCPQSSGVFLASKSFNGTPLTPDELAKLKTKAGRKR